MQVIRLINIVADAGWLPQPLASTIEIVELIDGADIADLLLLVWRCMHHAMTFGAKSWSMSDHVIPQNGGSGDPQVCSFCSSISLILTYKCLSSH